MRRVLLITGCTILVGIAALYALYPNPQYTFEQRQIHERFLLCRREAGFTIWTDLVMFVEIHLYPPAWREDAMFLHRPMYHALGQCMEELESRSPR